MANNKCPGCGAIIALRFNPVEKRHMVYCPVCGWDEEDGDNYKRPRKKIPCKECHGTGYTPIPLGGGKFDCKECWICKGTGIVFGR